MKENIFAAALGAALMLGAALALAVALAMPATAGADEIEPCEELEASDWAVDAGELAEDAPQDAPQTINAHDGVYEYGGRTETYYSSQVLYHWRTPEWWCDENGFWRTAEGYYVVAASDYAQGAVIETSMGLAQVLDCGCPEGVTDYYTAW